MLSIEQKNIILNVLSNPVFKFDFYNEKKLEELYNSVEKLLNNINEINIIDNIQNILSKGTIEFPCNYKYTKDKKNKTSYGLLCDDGADSLGFSEISSILLNLKGYNAVPVVSKLPNMEQCYFSTLVEDDLGFIKVITPERKRFCDKNGYNLLSYQSNMTYAVPNLELCDNEKETDFSKFKFDVISKPYEEIRKNYSILLTKDGRLNIKDSDVTPQIKGVLKQVLSDSVSNIYNKSLEFNNSNKSKLI